MKIGYYRGMNMNEGVKTHCKFRKVGSVEWMEHENVDFVKSWVCHIWRYIIIKNDVIKFLF